MIKAYIKRQKEQQEEKLILAYLGAYWNRIKRLPSLKSIIEKEQPKKSMTPEEMLEEIKKLNEKLGGSTY